MESKKINISEKLSKTIKTKPFKKEIVWEENNIPPTDRIWVTPDGSYTFEFETKQWTDSDDVKVIVTAKKVHTFGGLQISPGLLCYNGTGFEIKDNWTYRSDNNICGLMEGSTYFQYNDLLDTFSSDPSVINNKKTLDGWRIPTAEEWAKIINEERPGSTVNGVPKQVYQFIEINHQSSLALMPMITMSLRGLLLFPDNEVINTPDTSNFSAQGFDINKIYLDSCIDQGCVFLPELGVNPPTWLSNTLGFYMSSTKENDSIHSINFSYSANTCTLIENDLTSLNYPVRLVK